MYMLTNYAMLESERQLL
jgi:hypothetical protein